MEAVAGRFSRFGSSRVSRAVLAGVLLSIMIGSRAFAQGPYLVEDINPGRDYRAGFNSGVDAFVEVNGKLFFAGDDERGAGLELWVTDGTRAGTHLVKDIVPGTLSSEPANLTEVGGKLFFTADNRHYGYNGRELWVSDGTTAGTHMVKDIRPGSYSSEPIHLTSVNGTLFFNADTGLRRWLWTSDGTAEGTHRVMDSAYPSTGGPLDPVELTEVDGKLLFNSYNYLWASDGTDAGTYKIKHFLYDGPTELAEFGGKLFFTAFYPGYGHELWTSDGTAEGTQIVKDIEGGSGGGYPRFLTESNGMLFFVAYSRRPVGAELWRSDGTSAGTQLVKDIFPGDGGPYPTLLTDVDGQLFFRANDGVHGAELWTSDGTDVGTHMVKDMRLGSVSTDLSWLTEANGKLFFVAYAPDPIYPYLVYELWTSDGTEAGTYMVKDILPGSYSSHPTALTKFNEALFFTADSTPYWGNRELWTSDGTEAGTYKVTEVVIGTPSMSFASSMVGAGGILFFHANDGSHGAELWTSDGTDVGTRIVKDIIPGYGPTDLAELTQVGDKVFFRADDGVHGGELWTSDGTEDGTYLVKDIYPGAISQAVSELTEADGKVFFKSNDGVHSWELWVSDGTENGTYMVKDIDPVYPGLPYCSRPDCIAEVDGSVFFIGRDPEIGVNGVLWRSDGTEAGTHRIADYDGMRPWGYLTGVAGRIFFLGYTQETGVELWTSDGTDQGTHLVQDIYVGYNVSDYPGQFTAVGDRLFFSADDGVNGRELWVSDGTAAGTYMVKDIRPGSSSPYLLGEVGGALFFGADDGVHGYELWTSDGTEEGTYLVKDIFSGPSASYPTEVSEAFGWAVFRALDGVHGYEMWLSDGTEQGTFMLADIWPGPESSGPGPFVPSGGFLYCGADDGVHGRELWATPFNEEPVMETLEVEEVPTALGDSVTAIATFCDPDTSSGQTHVATIEWGDGDFSIVDTGVAPSVSLGATEECDDLQQITAEHVYASTGVYTVAITVTDEAGASDSTEFQYAVIYDPSDGFVTGGGWIDSPLGAYTPDLELIGRANFGFVSKYKKGASVPTGNTEFQFKVADLNFKSTAYEWLVIAGSKAMFKGEGTINGDGTFGFMLTAIDGDLKGGEDTFRIKIWDDTEAVVYDNQMGDEDDADAATGLGGGSIVVHKAK